jgi:hypothetical protein
MQSYYFSYQDVFPFNISQKFEKLSKLFDFGGICESRFKVGINTSISTFSFRFGQISKQPPFAKISSEQ